MKTFLFCVILLGLSTNLLANSPIAKGQTAKIEEFTSVGNEPFWNVTVKKSGIVYSTPDATKQTFPYVAPLKADGRPADLVRVYQLRGKGNNMLIIKKVSNCSDTMSDNKYSYSATLLLGNRVLDGCAYKNK
jgi:uncharacterized membrane protein